MSDEDETKTPEELAAEAEALEEAKALAEQNKDKEGPTDGDIYATEKTDEVEEAKKDDDLETDEERVAREAKEKEDADAEAAKAETKQPVITAEDIATAAKAIKDAEDAKKPKEEKKLTEEEIDKNFKPFKVDETLMKSMGFDDATKEQMAGMQQLVNGIVTQAITTSDTLANQRLAQVLDKLEPQINAISKREAATNTEKAKGDFYGKYKGLEGHEMIVQAATLQINPNDDAGKPKTMEVVEKELVTLTQAILAKSGIEIDPLKAANPSTDDDKDDKVVKKKAPTMASTKSESGRSQANNKDEKSLTETNPDAAIYS